MSPKRQGEGTVSSIVIITPLGAWLLDRATNPAKRDLLEISVNEEGYFVYTEVDPQDAHGALRRGGILKFTRTEEGIRIDTARGALNKDDIERLNPLLLGAVSEARLGDHDLVTIESLD